MEGTFGTKIRDGSDLVQNRWHNRVEEAFGKGDIVDVGGRIIFCNAKLKENQQKRRGKASIP